ncbi:NAD(P)-dependent oxidoreductase [Isoptericola sp. NPDC057191]|uniref:NAD(P)-dependent oxidoreductase n=1 Tax=Isoptericola sp. NPDC057191 TaxID=3346041 RepID=UPI00363F5B42
MTRITVLGGTGYAGSAIVREAAARGHEVTAFSRSAPADPVPGVTYRTGSALDEESLASVIDGVQAVVVALAPRGELEHVFAQAVDRIGALARAAGARLGVIGGAGTLLAAPDGPKVYETADFPAAYVSDSRAADEALGVLRGSTQDLDWFVVSPPLGFGSWAPGTATGVFRLGGDVLLTDDEGRSEISGADLATAVVDELDSPTHRRSRFTAAY